MIGGYLENYAITGFEAGINYGTAVFEVCLVASLCVLIYHIIRRL